MKLKIDDGLETEISYCSKLIYSVLLYLHMDNTMSISQFMAYLMATFYEVENVSY